MKRYQSLLILIASLLLAGWAYNEYLGPTLRLTPKIQQQVIHQETTGEINIGTGQELMDTGVTIQTTDTILNTQSTIRKINETCGENIGTCEQGLKCMYPCGIQGCEYTCLPEDERARP